MAFFTGLSGAWLWAVVATARIAIVSSSQLAEGQAPLRYADRDADRIAAVLRDLGDFEQVWVLKQVSADGFRKAFEQAQARFDGNDETELFVYYSGHADQTGLLLGHDHFSFRELRERLERSSASVRVVMVDACHAGQIVRAKGARRGPAFTLKSVDAPRIKGAAILAASAATEVAQESSEVEGSYFTHHMLSALRGAGDADGNGQVTLQEAYGYAYSRTVASTMPNLFGSQHPTFEYDMSGTGNLVLTRLARGASVVVFPPGKKKNYLLASTRHGVVAEAWADSVQPLRLAIPTGEYQILLRHDGETHLADLVVPARGVVHVDTLEFRRAKASLALAKGSLHRRSQELAIHYGVAAFSPGTISTIGMFGLGWMYRQLQWSWGAQLGYGYSQGALSNIRYEVDRLNLSGQLLRRMPLGFSEIHLGVSAGVMAVRQRLATETHRAIGPTTFGVLAADVPLAPWVSLRLLWAAGGIVMKVDDTIRVRPEIQSFLGGVFFF